ncbi:hypothetical protein RB200_31025 [Streptomyces sp. PmtG]
MAVWGQDGAVDGRRGRAAPRDAPALQLAGTALLLYALAAMIWIVYEVNDVLDLYDDRISFKALYDPREFLLPVAQTPHDWAFLVAALLVGALALGRRRLARGGLALLAALLLGLGLRELIGIMASDRYRDQITEFDYGNALLTFRLVGIVLACVLLTVVARTRGAAPGTANPPWPEPPSYPAAPPPHHPAAPPPPAYAPHAPYGDSYGPPPGAGRRTRPGLVVAGLALALCGVNALGWLIYTLTRDEIYFLGGTYDGDAGVGDFFRTAVDASHGLSLPYTFYNVAMIASTLLVGALLLSGRLGARGAGLALALVSVYVDVRSLVPGFDEGFDAYFDSTVGTWALWTTSATTALATVAAVALLATPED